jgi:hypothetical protein
VLRILAHKRDYYAGGLITLIGIGTVLEGRSLRVGTLTHMGPGFFPVMLGVALIAIGVLIAGSAVPALDGEEWPIVLSRPEWRGWACVIAGPLMFILFGAYGGLIPATFMCVFVSALGDRTATLKTSLLLAAAVTVFGVLLFHYVLRIPFPLLRVVPQW